MFRLPFANETPCWGCTKPLKLGVNALGWHRLCDRCYEELTHDWRIRDRATKAALTKLAAREPFRPEENPG